MTGEPHLTAFDQQHFDLQAAGEFIAAKSLDGNLEVQMRIEPWPGAPDRLASGTAAAARVGAYRVTIKGRSDGQTPLRIDGQPVEIPDGYYRDLTDAGGRIVRTGRRYSVVWPDGTNLHVDVFSRHVVNLFFLPAEPRDRRLAGILGDTGGNAFRTRDGKTLASPPEFETLYKVFVESWRIGPAESLFDYEPGQGTATFTRRDLPKQEVKIGDLSKADRARAEQRCRAAGISGAEALEEWIFDFGFTGDEGFIEAALSQQSPPELMEAAGEVTLAGPAEAIASSPIVVQVRGPAETGYLVLFAPAGSDADGRPGNPYSTASLKGGDQDVTLGAPFLPGDYELRYLPGRGETRVLVSKPFRSLAPQIHIEATDAAKAGASFQVRLTGDLPPGAAVTVVPVGSPDNAGGAPASIKGGADQTVRIRKLPAKPGPYEIRFVNGIAAGRQVYARKPLTIQ